MTAAEFAAAVNEGMVPPMVTEASDLPDGSIVYVYDGHLGCTIVPRSGRFWDCQDWTPDCEDPPDGGNYPFYDSIEHIVAVMRHSHGQLTDAELLAQTGIIATPDSYIEPEGSP